MKTKLLRSIKPVDDLAKTEKEGFCFFTKKVEATDRVQKGGGRTFLRVEWFTSAKMFSEHQPVPAVD